MKYKRIFLIVLDSVGIGEAPDADKYGDVGSNTIKTITNSEGFKISTLNKMGLYNIDGVNFGRKVKTPIGAYCKLQEQSKGKDTVAGHWEIAGKIRKKALPTYPDGFPKEIIDELEKQIGRKVICNKPYSGTEVIKDYGKEHMETGSLIVYTSADSVMQIAAHEKIVPLDDLYNYCKIARKILNGKHGVGRVIARPFEGEYPNFYRTANRHDFSLVPQGTMLNYLSNSKKDVIAVGKIHDIFACSGVTETIYTHSNKEGMEVTDDVLEKDFSGLCFVNLVDFDMLYGHRNDIKGYANAFMEFDKWFGEFVKKLEEDDVVFVTADHGCDPATYSTDHSREYIPFIAYGKKVNAVNLGIRNTFADIGKTILDNFEIKNNIDGKSFLKEISSNGIAKCSSINSVVSKLNGMVRKEKNISMYDIIEKKKNKKKLTQKEIEYFVENYTNGNIPDYQASALLMAICINGMKKDETVYLTNAMVDSGEKVNLSHIKGITVDKHSTGGIGDKTTLIVAPIVSALGCKVAKMSGRGLGYTGGTADKLESIPGYKTVLPMNDFVKQVNKTGISLITQSGNLTPADKKIYALRDITATVDSIPLIASSIMSKKIAAGSKCIVLDVKTGSGALVKDLKDSRKLAKCMVNIGKMADRKTLALITNMDIPLGNAIGNSLEVIEAVDVLNGNGPEDLKKICIELASYMYMLCTNKKIERCRKEVKEVINNGKAFEKFRELVIAQGGDVDFIDDTSKFPKAKYVLEVKASNSGYISKMNSEKIGKISVNLGAGRLSLDDKIDNTAGIWINKKIGDFVNENDTLAVLYSSKIKNLDEFGTKYLETLEFSNKKGMDYPLIYDIIQ